MRSRVRCQFHCRTIILVAVALIGCCAAIAHADDGAPPIVRVGTLKFGTVDWELAVMARHGLDRAHGFALRSVDFAGKDGANVALQGGAVDVILTDWLWVAKRRAMGGDFTFVPHSHITGGLMVSRESGIATLGDLKGRKLGIGGGPADKSWIILRAYARQSAGFDPARDATPVFAAPPLLNEALKRGQIPAALNFWQYEARLDQAKFRELIRTEDMLPALGLPADMPLLGWVFGERWAGTHAAALRGFLAAAAAARRLLAEQPEEWQAIRAMTGAGDDATLANLRAAYRRGIGGAGAVPDLPREAQQMMDLLVRLGDREDAPAGGKVPPGTFFAGPPA